MSKKKHYKPKILNSLLKVNIFAFLLVLSAFIGLNIVFATNLKNYDKVSNFIHDYADLAQYGISLHLRFKSTVNDKKGVLRIKSLMTNLAEDIQLRVEDRRADFEKLYSESEIKKFHSFLSPLSLKNFEDEFNFEQREHELENSYIQILKFSKIHSDRMEQSFFQSLAVASGVLCLIILLIVYFLYRKIKRVISPLKELTKISEKISLTDEKFNLKMNYDYHEYHVLAQSFRNMYQRINHESRVAVSTTANTSVSHLVENIAHAINNPLATIATSMMLVKKKSKSSEDSFVNSEIDVCLTQIDRVTEITHKMKSLISTSSKRNPIFFEFKNITTMINLLYFNRFLDRNVTFVCDENTEIYGKEEVITSVLISLIENSLAHNKNDKLYIEVQAKEKFDRWLITVHDNGVAMPIIDIYKYFLGDNTGEGLGLFSSRKLAEENGYNLYYNETPKKEFVLEVKKNDAAIKLPSD